MKTLNNFPDLGKTFELMKLKDDLMALNPDGSFTMALIKAAKDGKLKEAIAFVKEGAQDNRKFVVSLIGSELLNRIEKL